MFFNLPLLANRGVFVIHSTNYVYYVLIRGFTCMQIFEEEIPKEVENKKTLPPKEAAIAQAPSKSKETALKIVVAIGKLQELNNKLAAAMEEEKQYNNSQFKEYIKLNNQFSAHLHQADKVFQQMIRKVR